MVRKTGLHSVITNKENNPHSVLRNEKQDCACLKICADFFQGF